MNQFEEAEELFTNSGILLAILRKFDPKFTQNDFLNLESNNLLGILCAILQHIGMHLDMILEPQPHSAALFTNNPVSYSTTIKHLNIILIIKYFLRYFDINDFTFGDISRPQKSRILDLFNVLTTLIQLKEEKEQIFCDKLKEIISIEEKLKNLEEEQRELDALLPSKLCETDKLKEENSSRVQEIADAECEIKKCKGLVEEQSKLLESVKKEFSELNEKLRDVKEENSSLKNEIDTLTNNIVQSPQRIIEEAETCQRDMNNLIKQVNNLQQKFNYTIEEKSNLEQILEKIKSCSLLPGSLFEDYDKLNEISSNIDSLKATEEQLNTAIQRENFDIQLHTEQLEVTLKASQLLEANVEKKRDEAKKKLEHLQASKSSNIDEIGSLKLSLKQEMEKKKRLEEEINKLNTPQDDLKRFDEIRKLSQIVQEFENVVESLN